MPSSKKSPSQHSTPLLLLLLLLIPSPTTADADCYLSNGTSVLDLNVCYNPSIPNVNVCCRPWEICLTNRVCASVADPVADNYTVTGYYRGTCDSPSWPSWPGCPSFCLGHNDSDRAKTTWPMGRCPGDERWFCVGTEGGDGSVEDCVDPNFGFLLDGGVRGFTTLYVTESSTSSADGVGTSDGGRVLTVTTTVPSGTTWTTVTVQPSSPSREAGPGTKTVTVDTTLTVWVPPPESTSSSETASVWIETVPNPTEGDTTLAGGSASGGVDSITIVPVTLTVVPVSEPSVTSDVGAPLRSSISSEPSVTSDVGAPLRSSSSSEQR